MLRPVQYFTAAETNRLIRVALKHAFPACKFSVKLGSYGVRIAWTDGPTADRVDSVIGQFESKGFDGSIDMEYSIYAWVLRGEIIGTYSTGTVDSRGSVPAWGHIPPHDDAELVGFGTPSIRFERTITPSLMTRAVAQVAAYWGFDHGTPVVESYRTGEAYLAPTPKQDAEAFCRTGWDWRALVGQALADRSKYSSSN